MSVDWAAVPATSIMFYCRNCGLAEFRHVDGKCLFESTQFSYESHHKIAARMANDRYKGTQSSMEDVTEYMKSVFKDLEHMKIPDNK